MIPDYQPIEKHLRQLDYLTIISQKKTWFSDRVMGWNVKASSVIRKPYTVKRVEEEILKYDLPLIVSDPAGDHFDSFEILLKISDENVKQND